MTLHPMHVAIVPPALRDQYLRDIGESWFCAFSEPWHDLGPYECGGLAEITVGNCNICRKCAADLAGRLQSAVDLLAASEVSGWLS